jgi:phage head maturation protease
VRIAERIEQAMKRGKIEGSAIDFRTIMRDDSEGG